jgi:hypothetical protein
LEVWLSRLDSSGLVDLAEDGPRIVPELLDAYTPPDFKLLVLDGSAMWIEEGALVAELSAELQPVSSELEGTGVIQRRVDTRRGKADHFKFELPEAAQGAGRGRRVLRASVELYQALGVTEIRLTAVDKGKYVWAAAGFSFATEEGRAEVLEGIEFAAELLGISLADLDPDGIQPWQIAYMPPADAFTIRDALEALDPEGLEAVRDQADNLDEPLDRPGKVLLLADEIPGWQGRIDLRPSDDNPGLEYLYAYTD